MNSNPDEVPEEEKKKPAFDMAELDYLFQQAEDASAAMDRVYDRVMRAVTDIAMATYPELKQMEPDQIRHFGARLSYHANAIADDMDRISCWVESPERFDAEGNPLRADEL